MKWLKKKTKQKRANEAFLKNVLFFVPIKKAHAPAPAGTLSQMSLQLLLLCRGPWAPVGDVLHQAAILGGLLSPHLQQSDQTLSWKPNRFSSLQTDLTPPNGAGSRHRVRFSWRSQTGQIIRAGSCHSLPQVEMRCDDSCARHQPLSYF